MNDASANAFRSARVASVRLFAAAFILAVAASPIDAAEQIRLQVLWKADALAAWEGSIDVEEGEIAEFRTLGTTSDEPDIFRLEATSVRIVPGLERTSDGCEFATTEDATVQVSLGSPKGVDGKALLADLSVGELLDRPQGTMVRVGERELTIRRAPHDIVWIQSSDGRDLHRPAESASFVSRFRVGSATSVALDWKASLVSLRDGSVVWSEERATEAKQLAEEISLEWHFDTPDDEGVYRLVVEAHPRRFGSRWYRGEALARGTHDLLALGEASPPQASSGAVVVQISPGDSSWTDRVRSVSPMGWFASSESNDSETGVARTEQKDGVAWLVLEPGATRVFPLPASEDRRGLVVEIDVAAGEQGRLDLACFRGSADDDAIRRAFDESGAADWRVSLIMPDSPIPSPKRSDFETLRSLLPISSEQGTLVLRAADSRHPLRLAQIRVVEESIGVAADREEALAPRSRSTTLLIEDVDWPRRLSDGRVAGAPGPSRSCRLVWYEAALRLARYAKAEGYDAVCVPAVAEGGALRLSPEFSPRLIEGPGADPETVGPPMDAVEVVLSIFDRERVGLILAYSPSVAETFDHAATFRRWSDLLEQGSGHRSFAGLLMQAPAARFEFATTADRATPAELRRFERSLGVALPASPVLREESLYRYRALWQENLATEVAAGWEAMAHAASQRGAVATIDIGSDISPGAGDGSLPSTLRLFEQSGWSALRRFDFAPGAAPSIATRELRFLGPGEAIESRGVVWLRRTTFPSSANVASASRVDAAEEERRLMELALRDASGMVDSDRAFAPTLSGELADRRRTLSSLPVEPFAPASRRTPIGDDPLRLLVLSRDDGYWIAAINRAPWPVSAAIEFSSANVGRMRSLAGVSLLAPVASAERATWPLELEPYGVIAARFEGGSAEIVDWRATEAPSSGIDRTQIRGAIDDLSRRFAEAGDSAKRSALLQESFDALARSESGWKIDAGDQSQLSRATGQSGNALSLRPNGASIRLTSPAIAAPRAGFATASLMARVAASPTGGVPEVRLVAISGNASVSAHVSARVELTPPVAGADADAASAWQRIYVPVEGVAADFWNDWTLTLEVAGEGTLLVDEISVLDSFPSPERLAAWRKQLALAEFALREDRLFAASQALGSPSMRLVRACYGETNELTSIAVPSPNAPSDAPAGPERNLFERLWNWAPEPAFR